MRGSRAWVRWRWRGAMAIVVAVAGLATCCGPDDGTDAGPGDAGPRDAGVDAGPPDAGRRDAGHDAGAPPDPDWMLVEGLAPQCEVFVARNGPEIAGPLRFEPCEGVAGCQELNVDWTSEEQPTFFLLGAQPYQDGLGSILFLRGGNAGEYWYVGARSDGSVQAVVRTPPRVSEGCSVFRAGMNASRMVLFVATMVGGRVSTSYLVEVRFSDPTQPRVLAELSTSLLGAGHTAITPLLAGEDAVAVTIAPQSRVLGFTEAAGPAWLSSSTQLAEIDALANDAAFYRIGLADGPGREVWVATPPTAPGAPLITSVEFDATALHTDGTNMVWAQHSERVSPGVYGRVELWWSPFATTPAALEPQFVARLPTTVQSIARGLFIHGDRVLYRTRFRFTVLSTSGDMVGEVNVPPGTRVGTESIAYVGPDSFAYAPLYEGSALLGNAPLRIQRYEDL